MNDLTVLSFDDSGLNLASVFLLLNMFARSNCFVTARCSARKVDFFGWLSVFYRLLSSCACLPLSRFSIPRLYLFVHKREFWSGARRG